MFGFEGGELILMFHGTFTVQVILRVVEKAILFRMEDA
jgi:hypothetical protein